MSRPRKLDALTPAERARRYRARRSGRLVPESVTESVTETVTETVTAFPLYRLVVDSPSAAWPRVVTETVTETDWPFPGSPLWFQRYGYAMAHPGP